MRIIERCARAEEVTNIKFVIVVRNLSRIPRELLDRYPGGLFVQDIFAVDHPITGPILTLREFELGSSDAPDAFVFRLLPMHPGAFDGHGARIKR